jgi:hypothetical protein
MKNKVIAVFSFIITSLIVFSFYAFAAESNKASDSVNITYKTSFEKLYDSTSEKMYILIENVTDKNVILKDIRVISPEHVTSKVSDTGYINSEIAPQNTAVIPVNITPDSTIRPGKNVIIYNISMKCTSGNKLVSFNKIISVDVEMAVNVSSDLLTVAGVPSLIFIPGFIIVVILSFFIKPYVKGIENADAKSPLFWVISISIGLVVVYIYPVFSEALGRPGHDLLKNYGLEDILALWMSSLLFALVLSAILVFFLRRRINKKIFRKTDGPLTVIYKLKRFQKSIVLPKINVNISGSEMQLNLIPKCSDKQFACPDIAIEINRKKVKKQDKIKTMNNDLRAIVEKSKDITELSSYLHHNRRKLNVKWDCDQVRGIVEIPEEYTEAGERSFIEYK